MQLKCFNCLSAHTIYLVGPPHSLVNNFLAFINFFNVSYNIDLFKLSIRIFAYGNLLLEF